jgi:hypothetical protein
MAYLAEKVAYCKGLMDGLNLEKENEAVARVFRSILDVLNEIASAVDDLDDAHDDLSEHVRYLEDDLDNLEDIVAGDCDFEHDDEIDKEFGSMDDDDDTDYFEIHCPHCKEDVMIDFDMIDEENSIICPNCKSEIELVFDCGDDECDCCGDDD